MTAPTRSGFSAIWRNPWYLLLGSALVVVNVAVSAVWRFVAPGQQFKVFGDGRYLSLPTADYHPFDGIAIFALATGALGLVAAVALWRVRAVRGVSALIVLAVTTAVGALVAASLAGVWSAGTSPSSLAEAGRDIIVTVGPHLATPLAIVAEPLVAVICYTFLAAWDGRSDLGRRRDSTDALG